MHTKTILQINEVSQTMKRTIALCILDGWGIGSNDTTNAIYAANPPIIKNYMERYPSGALLAHGISVGLPWDEAGTGEAGHRTIGAGRIVYQPLPRITLAVRNGSFMNNPALVTCLTSAAQANATAHLIGTLSEKNAHASMEHLMALIQLAQKIGVKRIRIHAIIGSEDSGPRGAVALIKKIPWDATIKLASIIGRHYATDSNSLKNEAVVHAILGLHAKTDDAEKYLHDFYLHDMNDAFAEPVTIGPDPRGIEEKDAILFFDFDGSPLKGLVETLKNNTDLPHKVSITTLTDYCQRSDIAVAFTEDIPQTTLGKELSRHKKIQFRIAETDRYTHITYFMNGSTDELYEGEYRILVPSENVARKDERPEMMMHEVASRGITAIEEGADFVVMNFGAPDILAHTGNFEATKKAILAADRELGLVAQAVLARGGALIVTSDHGNAEKMRDPITGRPETTHNTNPVPVILIAHELEKAVHTTPTYEGTVGFLSDIAPTVLAFMGIPQPTEMTGSSLIGKLT